MNIIFRNILIAAGLVLILVFFNGQIRKTEALTETGETVLIKLRPVDPRELMMGDYMALAYDRQIYPAERSEDMPPNGVVILKLDENRVASFARFDTGADIENGQVRMKYVRKFSGDLEYGGQRFYFQEGTASAYEPADYGVFKVDSSGRAILTALAGQDFQIIKPAKPKP